MTHHSSVVTSTSCPGHSRRLGFSLVEIIMVVVICGLLIAAALPRSSLASYEANSGARVVSTILSYAQREAVSQQADVRVAFDLANSRMRIHEDRNNDNAMDAAERVVFTNLPEGVTFGRGAATARAMGAADVTFTRTQTGMPVLIFHRDGTASENGGLYLSTFAGLSVGRAEDVRAVEVSRATGRPIWFSFGTGTWKQGT